MNTDSATNTNIDTTAVVSQVIGNIDTKAEPGIHAEGSFNGGVSSYTGSPGDPADAIENASTFGNYLIHGIDEIILPEAISYLPTAPGWWFIGAMFGVWLLVKIRQGSMTWWRNRYRREALRQLNQLQGQAGDQLYDVVALLPHYLKVTALQAYPREEVASLSGRPWLAFLDAHHTGPAFSKGPAEKLVVLSYLPRDQWQLDEAESRQLISMVRHWIKSHSAADDV